jgi:hypothetical protein
LLLAKSNGWRFPDGSLACPYRSVQLSDWLAHSPIDMVAETLNLDPSVIARFPKNRPVVVPA